MCGKQRTITIQVTCTCTCTKCTGSVVKHNNNSCLDIAFKEYQDLKESNGVDGCSQCLKLLQLRYFTPREVSNLMCFPESFDFPSDMTLNQKYRVLGNSVNVLVVSVLLQYLLLT